MTHNNIHGALEWIAFKVQGHLTDNPPTIHVPWGGAIARIEFEPDQPLRIRCCNAHALISGVARWVEALVAESASIHESLL